MLGIILEWQEKPHFQTALHANIYNYIIHHSNKQNIRVRMWMYKTRGLSSFFLSLVSRDFQLLISTLYKLESLL